MSRRAFQASPGPINPRAGANLRSWFKYDGSKDDANSLASLVVGGLASDVLVLSSTLAVMVYVDADNSDRPTAALLDITGNTVAVLDTLELNTTGENANGYNLAAGKIDSRYFLVATCNSAKAIVVDTNGGALAIVGTPSAMPSMATLPLALSDNLNSTGKLILFRGAVTTNDATVCACTPNTGTGATTFGSDVTLSTTNVTGSNCPTIVDMGSGYFAVSWQDSAARLALGSLSGTTITHQNSATNLNTSADTPDVIYIGSDEVFAPGSGRRYKRTTTALALIGSSTGPVMPFTCSGFAYSETIGNDRYFVAKLRQTGGDPNLDSILGFIGVKLTADGMLVCADAPTNIASTKAALSTLRTRLMKLVSTSRVLVGYTDTFGSSYIKCYMANL